MVLILGVIVVVEIVVDIPMVDNFDAVCGDGGVIVVLVVVEVVVGDHCAVYCSDSCNGG